MFIAIPALFIAIGIFDAMNDTPAPIVEPNQTQIVQNHQMITVSTEPSGWACDDVYIPSELINYVEIGENQGIHLQNPKDPSFYHYISCTNLVDIYG